MAKIDKQVRIGWLKAWANEGLTFKEIVRRLGGVSYNERYLIMKLKEELK